MPGVSAPVLAGAEPFSAIGGNEGVLVLHGFTGSPHSLRGVAEALADSGMTVELPLLPGHGTAIDDLLPCRWSDWSSAAEEAYLSLAARCTKVAIVGLSMGGTLTCWLAERHPEVVGVVLVNPLVEPPADDARDAIAEIYRSGTAVAPGIGSDIAEPGVTELAYDGTPLAAVLSLFEGVEGVALGLADISCPVLLFSSRTDHVVAPSNGDLVVDSVSGPCERIWLERSYHVATLDYDRDEIDQQTVAFVGAVMAGATA
jgi:carboxylesterase